MEITVKSAVLKKECEKLEGILPAKPTIAITGGILIESKDENVLLTATDLESTIRTNIKCEKNVKGTAVISGKKFISLVKQLPGDDIKLIKKDNAVELRCKTSKYSFICMDEKEFPAFPKFTGDISFYIKGRDMKNAIEKIRFCIDPEEPRPHFRGGLLDVKEGLINFIGTDTKRLALFSVKTEEKNMKPCKCLMPFKLLGVLSSLLNEEDVEILTGKSQISFQYDNTHLISQLLSGSEDFPDYGKVIPEDSKLNYAHAKREDFFATLKRISLFTSERYNKVKLLFSKKALTFSINSPEVGEAQEKIDIEYSKNEQELAFPPAYLMDFLQKATEEKVMVGFSNEKNPVLFKGEEHPEYLYIAMPLKLE